MIVPEYHSIDYTGSELSRTANELLFEALAPLLYELHPQGSLHHTVSIYPHHLIRNQLRDGILLFLPGGQVSLVIYGKRVGDEVPAEALEEGEGGETLVGRMVQLGRPTQFVQEGEHGVLDEDVVLVDEFRSCPNLGGKPLLTEGFEAICSQTIVLIEVECIGVE
jgi:hypothetical protein